MKIRQGLVINSGLRSAIPLNKSIYIITNDYEKTSKILINNSDVVLKKEGNKYRLLKNPYGREIAFEDRAVFTKSDIVKYLFTNES